MTGFENRLATSSAHPQSPPHQQPLTSLPHVPLTHPLYPQHQFNTLQPPPQHSLLQPLVLNNPNPTQATWNQTQTLYPQPSVPSQSLDTQHNLSSLLSVLQQSYQPEQLSSLLANAYWSFKPQQLESQFPKDQVGLRYKLVTSNLD